MFRQLLAIAIGAWFSLAPRVADASGVEPTRISLPKGPGSVEGLGRSFVPSLASGTSSYGIDIAVPPAVGGFGPKLSLEYDAGSGASEVGLGWRIAGVPSIRRRVDEGLPRFDPTDRFELQGVGVPSDLLEVAPDVFRPELESGAFARVERSADRQRWEARVKNGFTYRFGGQGCTEAEADHVATYLLSEQHDLHGHVIRYNWDASDGYALLQSVTWNDFSASTRIQVVFTFEPRPDVYERFSSGIRQRIAKRLEAITVTYGGELVRRYNLRYGDGPHSRLLAVDLVGTDGVTGLPALRLDYTEPSFATDGQVTVMKNAPGRSPADPDVALADVNGDALPDLLVTQPGAYRSYLNQDGISWNSAADWNAAESPSLALSAAGTQLADLDGDGAIDLVAKSGTTSFRYFPGKDATSFAPAVSIRNVPSFTFEDPDVHLADMDGDRRIDVVVTTAVGIAIGYNLDGHDFTEPVKVGPVDTAQPLRFSDGGKTHLCDVNGDRVQDFCYLRSQSLVYWLGRGRGRFEPARTATGVPEFDASSPWQLQDLDGDGWVDLVHVGVGRVEYALAKAEGAFGAPRAVAGVPEKGPGGSVSFADMNGSGTTDILWIDPTDSPESVWRYLELFPDGRGGLLKTIHNGLGKITRVEYEPAALGAARARDEGRPWSTRMNVGMPVVRRITVDASLGDPPLVTEFGYRDGTWDPRERTFAGFGSGITRELGDEYTPTLVTEDTFDTGLLTRLLRGVTIQHETRDERGRVFTRTSNTFTTLNVGRALDGRSISYAYRAAERVELIEGASAPARTTLTEWVHDAFGNVVEERRWGEVVGADPLAGNDEALTLRTYANNEADWLLGYMATEEVQDAARNRATARRWFYDGEPFRGLPTGEVARGDVTREEEWIGPGADDFVLDTATKYDAHGMPIETSDARGGGRVYEWLPEDPGTLTSERVKLDTGVDLTERAEIDPRFGNLLAVVEYNGQTTRFQYDALGRLAAVVKPGDDPTAPTIRYEYVVGAPLSRVITSSRIWSGKDEFERSEAVFDGLGRKRAALTRDESERWVLAGVDLLDARGKRRRSLRPRFVTGEEAASPPLQQDAPGASAWRDAVGREVRTRSEIGIESRTEYAPLVTSTWDGGQSSPASSYEHTPSVKYFDGLGRMVRATQTLEGRELSALFGYDAFGRLRQKTDPEGNVASYEYDGQGRRTLVDDPDLGRRLLVYDETGNLIERRNPDGSTLRYTFDLAGRPLTEDYDGDGVPEVAKTWDEHPNHPGDQRYRGKLARIVEPSGSTDHEYDERGHAVRTEVTIQGKHYSSASTFDNLDREVLHGYPDGSSIRIHRNPRGQLSGYGDAVRMTYDGDGLEIERRFNTGVAQQSSYDADRRFDELKTITPDGSAIEHLKWTYDLAGNVASIQDLRPGIGTDQDRSETYTYDNLYRLRRTDASWGHTEWTYSPSGNLLQRASTLTGQNGTDIRYGQGAGPHAMTALDGRSLSYDALGRLLDDGERAFIWNAADQLVRATQRNGGSVENLFDASGIRRVRLERHADGSTSTLHYISPWAEVRDGKLIRYIVHADRRIARLSDHNGIPSPASSMPPGNGEIQRVLLILLTHFGQVAVFAALALALVWRMRRTLARSARLLVPTTGVLLLALCSCSEEPFSLAPAPAKPLGSVQTLTDADAILVTDQLGSALAETSGTGKITGRFSAYPYGVSRYDSSTETHKYAGSIRDEGLGLDLMGARFYAPDLGVWTSADPVALNDPERSASEQFGTANPYAYANLNPTTAIDRNGEFWHIVAGAAIGGVLGGGFEAARQYIEHGKVEDWGRVGAAAAGGAIAGALTAAVPAAGVGAVVAVGAVSGAAGGVTERLVASGGKSAGTLSDVVSDAFVGGLTAGVFKGAGAVIKRAAAAKPPVASRAVSKVAAAAEGAMCPCFAAETLVTTAEGDKAIRDVHVGDLVLARDPDSGETAFKPVTTVWVTPSKPLVELQLARADGSAETIRATPGHPFWVEGRGWTNASDLTLTDQITTSVSDAALVVAASTLSDVSTVYNLEVANFHTYFVGETKAWVHNACNCGGGSGGSANAAPKPFSSEKAALVNMAKADKKVGISRADMEVYKELNDTLPDPFPKNQVRGPEVHPLRTSNSTPGPGQQPHGHVGPVDHIPIED